MPKTKICFLFNLTTLKPFKLRFSRQANLFLFQAFLFFKAQVVASYLFNENKRNRKATKRGRKRFFSASIFKERFSTIERVFAWEDKFKRLLVRFEHISAHHYSMKTIAYTMINLRHFCKP